MEQGEGATSMGAMVPLIELPDASMAEATAKTLEAHAILAIIDGEVGSPSVPKSPSGRPRVWVPSSMFQAAKVVLQNHASEIRSVVPTPIKPPAPAAAFFAEEPVDAEIEDEDPPRELPVPEPSSLQLRLTCALLAIALGIGLQLGLTTWLGADARGVFGARQPLLFEPWRLITASFMHGGLSHALSNGAFGLLLGTVLLGTHRIGATAFVWLAASAVGLLAEVALSPGANVIGASAGNYGLVGLWAVGQVQRAQTRWLVRRELIRTAGVLLLLLPGAITPFSSTGTRIAVLAHVFGFVAGAALGTVFKRRLLPEYHDAIDRKSRTAGALAVALTAAAWTVAVVTMAP